MNNGDGPLKQPRSIKIGRTTKIMRKAQKATILGLPLDIMQEVDKSYLCFFPLTFNQRYLRICGLLIY